MINVGLRLRLFVSFSLGWMGSPELAMIPSFDDHECRRKFFLVAVMMRFSRVFCS
jgi:hypothetical protein